METLEQCVRSVKRYQFVNFEHTSYISWVFPLLNLKK